jgi:two-component system, chemotaxis family, protein-glutamate methylesterase/glutaminase
MPNPIVDRVPVRVLIVDDSAFMRFTISKHLSETEGILVVGTARDGKEALEVIPRLNPDVITLDVEMPHLDGLSTLREIMRQFPRPVIMISSLTSEGTLETVQALTLGAVDFIAKPSFKANISSILNEVGEKVLRAAKAKVWKISEPRVASTDRIGAAVKVADKKIRPLKNEKVVIIGSSTGGPRALNTVIPQLPGNLPAAFMIIQHMPAGFTRSLADRLDQNSNIYVKEAEPGDGMMVGGCLLAPGGFHMTLDSNCKISLNQNPPVHGVRPAVDVTMISAVKQFDNRIIAVILTGMGNDGTNGSALVHSSGGYVIAEAEETSVVWGMPRSVIEAGAANEIVPLFEVPRAIIRALES